MAIYLKACCLQVKFRYEGAKIETTYTKNIKSAIRVLQVDRDKVFLSLSKEIFQLFCDFEIDVASSFVEAHNALEKKQYDVIVSGYFFDSEKNGLDFFKELNVKGNKVPFIMLSVNDEAAIEALKLGVTKFISKN